MNARFHRALRVLEWESGQLRARGEAMAAQVQVLGELISEAAGARHASSWDQLIEAAKVLEHEARHLRPGPEFFRELRRGVIQEARRVRAAHETREVDQ